MAIMDALLRFSSAQAVTVSVASTNIIDLGVARDIGIGAVPMQIQCYVTSAFVGAGVTLQVSAQGSADDVTWTTYATGPVNAVGLLAAGRKLLPIAWPPRPGGHVNPRYLRLFYTVAGGTFTAGSITSDLVLDRNDNILYPAALTVTV